VAKKSQKELKDLTKDELVKKARETEAGLFQAKMKHATGQLEDTASLWRMRKTLARVKTLMSQKAAQ
jgi:large subunit ribosomal protein L29